MHVTAQSILLAALIPGAIACGGAPTIRQEPGTATPDRAAATALPAPASQPPVETVGVTQVHLEYRRGDGRIDASIVDTGLNQSYLAPFTLFLAQGYKKETP